MTKKQTAKQLAALAGVCLQIDYQPTAYYGEDLDSRGHLYGGFVRPDPDWHDIELDDRKLAPLEVQLVAELRRIGQRYLALARRVEARALARQAAEAA